MKTKQSFFFPVAVSAIYILSFVIFIFSLTAEYKKGKSESQVRFNSITRDLSRISHNYAPQSKKFYDEFLSSLGNVSDVAGLQLKYGDELIFSYPRKISELENINSSLVSTFTTTIFTENGIPLLLTSSIYLLKPSSIFYKGRIAFIVIFLATVATAVYLLVLIHNGTFPTEKEMDEAEEKIQYPEIESYDDFPEAGESAEEEEIPVQEESAPQKEEDVLAFLNEPPKEVPAEFQEAQETQTEDAENSAEEKEPSGLFSPDTGFGWEEYMLTRLESELVRSASSDQDLALFTMRISGIDWKSDCGKEVSRTILETVKFNDLVFNYGDDGATAIFQNKNTDKALETAEELHTKISAVLSKSGSEAKAFIGISTRSLRLISGTRLANESEEALKRAMTDEDSPIIAFRVNPERYKNFLASESFQDGEPIIKN